ncbi:MAG TPA: hypothetical protein VJ769_09665, partial [Actinomycetes bacterium]|nr:hypothetical protein [Actinomycetes bacterium]
MTVPVGSSVIWARAGGGAGRSAAGPGGDHPAEQGGGDHAGVAGEVGGRPVAVGRRPLVPAVRHGPLRYAASHLGVMRVVDIALCG